MDTDSTMPLNVILSFLLHFCPGHFLVVYFMPRVMQLLQWPMLCVKWQVEIERGKTLHVVVLAKGDVNKDGEREVFFELNGQMRTLHVKDKEAMKVLADVCQAYGVETLS